MAGITLSVLVRKNAVKAMIHPHSGREINISSGHRRFFSDLEADLCPEASLPTDGASVQSMLYRE